MPQPHKSRAVARMDPGVLPPYPTEASSGRPSNVTEPQSRYEDGTYLAASPTWHSEDAAWKARHILEILRELGLQPKTVADVGCGAGGVLANLQSELLGTECDGFDISSQSIEIARTHERPGLRFHARDFVSQEGSFDLLLCLDVFEHVDDYLGFLRKLATRAEHVVFHIPLDMSTLGVARRWHLQTRASLGHLHYFSVDTARETLRDTGYEILAERSIDGDAEERKLHGWKSAVVRSVRRLLFTVAPTFAIRHLGGRSLMVLARPLREAN